MSLNKEALDTLAVNNFREYLRIPTVHPNVDYEPCVTFLKKQAASLDLPIKVYYVVPKKPIVVITWAGTQPTLPTIMINSHMDVVPAFENQWTHKPFDAEIDEQNNIYARGAQDMKCLSIQYIEAVRRLKLQGVTLKRTLHLSFGPDEEIGGKDGMGKFVHTENFKKLNIGMALEEGLASPNEEFVLYNGERCIWQFHIHCPGNPGHGSLLLKNTAGEKVSYILNKFYEFRNQQKQKLKDNPSLTIGDITMVNLTVMKGGVQTNVIPPEFVISIDCRIPPENVDAEKWEKTIKQWCEEAGSGVWIEDVLKQPQIPPTKLDDSNPYWLAFKKAFNKLGLKLTHHIRPGATDGRYVRGVGLPVLSFSPMNNTPILMHNNDEYLGVNTFLKGIEICSEILVSVGNVENTSG